MHKYRRLAFDAVLAALALIIFVVEAQIPSPVPVPGVKLGLANIITLTAMALLSKKDAAAVLAVRLVLGALFAGSPSTLLFSAAGGALAFAAMCLFYNVFKDERIWLTSVIAAAAHNVGQFIVCLLVVKTRGMWIYLPVLLASGIITGLFTGFAAKYLVKALKKINFD